MTIDQLIADYDFPGSVVLLEGKRDVLDDDKDKLIALGQLLAGKTNHILFRKYFAFHVYLQG